MKERRRARPGIKEERLGGVRLQTISGIMIAAAVLALILMLYGLHHMSSVYEELQKSTNSYVTCQDNAQDMIQASDYLTHQARAFAVTGEQQYLDNYFRESDVTKRRDMALQSMEEIIPDSSALEYLGDALNDSIALMKREIYSMRLVVEGRGYDLKTYPKAVQQVSLSDKDQQLSKQEKLDLAVDMVYDDAYQNEKDKIISNVQSCLDELLADVELRQAQSFQALERTIRRLTEMIFAIIAMFILLVILVMILIFRPLEHQVENINNKTKLPMRGAYEVQYLASVYNRIFDENQAKSDRLAYEAVHDMLTGLYNRAGFEQRYNNCDKNTSALILIDVDRFKEVNDNYGHATGDLILKKVADQIRDHFRAEDYVCRIGGDEFAVIMLFAGSDATEQVREKIRLINEELEHPADGLPAVSLSVGVAFGDRKDPTEDMFKDADAALYRVKRSGRNSCEFY